MPAIYIWFNKLTCEAWFLFREHQESLVHVFGPRCEDLGGSGLRARRRQSGGRLQHSGGGGGARRRRRGRGEGGPPRLAARQDLISALDAAVDKTDTCEPIQPVLRDDNTTPINAYITLKR